MSEIDFIGWFIPEKAYKYIVLGLFILLIFRQKIPILNKVDVTVKLPEEFMRNFRWITPLLVAGLYIWAALIYFALRAILEKLNMV